MVIAMKAVLKWHIRVQRVGGSFMITLPRLWCNARRINKGDVVQLAVTSTGDLLVSPSGGGGDE